MWVPIQVVFFLPFSFDMYTEIPIKKTLSQIALSDEDYVSPENLQLSEQPDINLRAKVRSLI